MRILFLLGKQIGRMKSVIGTRSLSRNRATSLSKFEKLNGCEMARRTKRVSGRVLSSQRSCSPKVTLIINHIKLKIKKKKKIQTKAENKALKHHSFHFLSFFFSLSFIVHVRAPWSITWRNCACPFHLSPEREREKNTKQTNKFNLYYLNFNECVVFVKRREKKSNDDMWCYL